MSAIENEGFNGFPVPIGTVMMWANNSAKPQLKADLESYSGFLVCDGRCLLISEYPELYKVLGGAANPYNTNVPAPCPAGEFRLPNCPDPEAPTDRSRSLRCRGRRAEGAAHSRRTHSWRPRRSWPHCRRRTGIRCWAAAIRV